MNDQISWTFPFATATQLEDKAGWRFTSQPERLLWVELAEAGTPKGPSPYFAGDPDVLEYKLTAPSLDCSVIYSKTSEGALVISIMLTNEQHTPASALLHVRLGGLGNTYAPAGASDSGLAQMGSNDACVLLTNAPEASWSVEPDGAGIDLEIALPSQDKKTLTFAYTNTQGRPQQAGQDAAKMAEQVLAEHAAGIWSSEGQGDILLEKR